MAEDKEKQNDVTPDYIRDESDIPADLSAEMDKILQQAGEGPLDDEEAEDDTPAAAGSSEDNDDLEGDDTENDTDVGAEGDDVGDDDSEPAGDEDDFEPIDPRLVSAARRYGWTDDKIEKVASEDISILEDLAAAIDAARQNATKSQETKQEPEPEEQDSGAEPRKRIELTDDQLDVMKEKFGDEATELISGLTNQVNELGSELDKVHGGLDEQKKRVTKQQQVRELQMANEAFDSAAEVFPELGRLEDLPRNADGTFVENSPAFKARADIYNKAAIFKQAGESWQDALDDAMDWYAGRQGIKQAEDKVVKDLNARKKKVTNRPTRKKSKPQYSSEEEKKEATMTEIFKDVGIED